MGASAAGAPAWTAESTQLPEHCGALATRYRPGRSSAAVRVRAPVSVRLRVTAGREAAGLLAGRKLAGVPVPVSVVSTDAGGPSAVYSWGAPCLSLA